MILIGTITRITGLSICEFYCGDQGQQTIIVTDNSMPLIPHLIQYTFDCNYAKDHLYANKLMDCKPVEFCDAVAKALYDGVLGMSHLFYHKPSFPLERFLAHRRPKMKDLKFDAFVWANFGTLAIMARLVQGNEWHLYPPLVLDMFLKRQYLELTYYYDIVFNPETLACYLDHAEEDLIEDLRFLNHLQTCTAEYGLVVSSEQGEDGKLDVPAFGVH